MLLEGYGREGPFVDELRTICGLSAALSGAVATQIAAVPDEPSPPTTSPQKRPRDASPFSGRGAPPR